MKFALGTAAWRTNYGSFPNKIIPDKDATNLVETAWKLGFEYIDTAPSYGDTEKLLGLINPKQSIATKITVGSESKKSIEHSIEQSLLNLKVDSISLIFVHNWDNLSESVKIETCQILNYLKAQGKICRWGISTYEISEIHKYKELNLQNTVFQINVNILDQRIERISDKVRQDLRERNIEIWARSIFLQGVLINQTPDNKFLKHPDVANFFKKSVDLNINPIDLSLGYIRRNELIDLTILGIFSNSQLEVISKSLLNPGVFLDFEEFSSSDSNLVDPRSWKH